MRKWNFGVKIIFEDNDFNIHLANLLPVYLHDLDKINSILFFFIWLRKDYYKMESFFNFCQNTV